MDAVNLSAVNAIYTFKILESDCAIGDKTCQIRIVMHFYVTFLKFGKQHAEYKAYIS